MIKPDFFIVGAPRCGTTAMHTYLKQHPDVFMAQKESHYFAKDHVASYVVREEEQYDALFDKARAGQLLGEASVHYLYSKVAPECIRRCNGNARILILLRNPVDLLHSLYHHYLYVGAEDVLGFELALDADEGRRNGTKAHDSRYFSGEYLTYKDMVNYARYIERYLDVFGPSRVLVVILEEFISDPVNVYHGVLDFLGLNRFDPPDGFGVINRNRNIRNNTLYRTGKKLHAALAGRIPAGHLKLFDRFLRKLNTLESPRRPLVPTLRQRLQAELRPEVDALAALLQTDLRCWASGTNG